MYLRKIILIVLIASSISFWAGWKSKPYVKGAFAIKYYDKYIPVSNSFLVFNHDAPWDSFSIQEKMFLCAYGSSGNKLSDKELEEIKNLYGGR